VGRPPTFAHVGVPGPAVFVAMGLFFAGLAAVVPILYHVPIGRPTTAARIRLVSPHPNQVLHGDPATVPVSVDVEGGTVTPVTSLHLVADTGHVHLYLDGHLASMTGASTEISVPPGRHSLEAEFVAMDHLPFRPRVTATVTFRVQG
jgi:hypothetical protein